MLYDHLPPAQAAAAAWQIEGPVPEQHRRAQAELRRSWPVLAAALDRLPPADAHRAITPEPSRRPGERTDGTLTHAAVQRQYEATRRDLARTGRLWLTLTAAGAWAGAYWLGTTSAWVILGLIGAAAALGALGAHRDTR